MFLYTMKFFFFCPQNANNLKKIYTTEIYNIQVKHLYKAQEEEDENG